MASRTILATLDGSSPHERLQVALVQRRDDRLRIDLRQQHYAEGIGWFDQRALELDPRQLRGLLAVLGPHGPGVAASSVPFDEPAILPFPGPPDCDGRPGRKTGSDAL